MDAVQSVTRFKWTLDPSHSQIGFRVKHLMVTNIRGVFGEHNGNLYRSLSTESYEVCIVNHFFILMICNFTKTDQNTPRVYP